MRECPKPRWTRLWKQRKARSSRACGKPGLRLPYDPGHPGLDLGSLFNRRQVGSIAKARIRWFVGHLIRFFHVVVQLVEG